ncbi:general secretion pathway protein GspK [Jannaschia sp. W003]|uniref:general secretion pathway protein GspK n=1 Tax=Jannaschia sp. W003 TaxID=2867012 RepID=UPI0021A5E866|nr:general secretion pathway protein GspK [Jannaschia sp. W003]UWQ23165.1 general secretion pathway protein GspK [Jannaschia sp. W003]
MTAPPAPREREDGVVLVNVLVVLALAATMVALMLQTQEGAIDDARRLASAAQARALAFGGEASVTAALRRDKEEAPEVDHVAEPWALGVIQEAVELPAGRFAVAVEDAQARYDLNRLAQGGNLVELQTLARLLAALGLPAEIGPRLAARMAQGGAIAGLGDLGDLLDPEALAALKPHVDALPPPPEEEGFGVLVPFGGGRDVNLASAGEPVLAAVLANPAAAKRLVAARARSGMPLVPEDLARAGLGVPPGAGFVSDVWDTTVLAEVDGIAVTLRSRLLRAPDGTVGAVGRRLGP